MSSVLNRAKAHYKERLNEPKRIVKVEEWGDDQGPLEIFISPANLATRDKIYKYAAQGSLEALVESIILRAKDADGIPVFSSGDKQTLMRQVDPDVIARVATEISEDLDLDETEAYKEAGKD